MIDDDVVTRLMGLHEHIEAPHTPFGADALRGKRMLRRRRALAAGAAAAAVVAVLGIVAVQAGESQVGKPVDPALPASSAPSLPSLNPVVVPRPTASVSGEIVLKLQSWTQGFVELAVYSDGWVIWVPSDQEDDYIQIRLTPEGVERLSERAASTGLFERNVVLGLNYAFGNVELHRGGRSVTVAWGKRPQNQFVVATPVQASALMELEEFLRDPFAWALPRDMYEQAEASPFIPTHLWVSWDRSAPDPSKLPPLAREVLTSALADHDRCALITLTQAAEIAQVMGVTRDIRLGLAFDMPGDSGPGISAFHAHPSLPHESTCD